MKTIEVEGLRFFYYLTWKSNDDSSSISFIPKEESLIEIMDQNLSSDKILYDIFCFMDEFFYPLRDKFDFIPVFKKSIELFEINIIKKDISSKELSGFIHEYLKAA